MEAVEFHLRDSKNKERAKESIFIILRDICIKNYYCANVKYSLINFFPIKKSSEAIFKMAYKKSI